jgi:tetratricopeptide (TPR) repeat protein
MTARGAITAFVATSFEAAAIASALHGSGLLALTCHAAACCCFVQSLHRRVLDGPRPWAFALLFAGAFFVPVLGAAGIVVVALTTPAPSSAPEPEWVHTPIPVPSVVSPEEPAADAAPPARQARLEALAELRRRSDPAAIGLLRRALEDPEEDVRLVGYALLESKSRAAYRAIHESTRALEETPARSHAVHRALAFQHWELAWLGLAQGECLSHALGMARHHSLAALDTGMGSASLYFLLGRIHLRASEPEQAESAFKRAAELGAAPAALGPWLAEAAYAQRRFDLVRDHLSQADLLAGSEAVERLRRYWT